MDAGDQRRHTGQGPAVGIATVRGQPEGPTSTAAGGLEIDSTGLSRTGTVVTIALFTAVAASTVSIPLVLHAVMGERMLGPLSKAKDWLELHNAAVLAVVITVIGVYLTVKGLR